MALSDKLTDLASRIKELEDAAAATKAKNHAKLEQQREQLNSKMKTQAQSIQSSATKAKGEARSWWTDTTAQFEQQRAKTRAKMDQQKANFKSDRAELDAEDAENYAADMVDWAIYAVDSAQYAVIDAYIARDKADSLTAARG
ncbi:MAG TPA: hypothetical protein VN895_03190 [Candidatus Acidoferrum sp.]|nr:hypothetical protein [Candidatus Acidoferrum sp.]